MESVQGVIAGVGFVIFGIVLIAFAEQITAAMLRTAGMLCFPRSPYETVFVRFVGWLAMAMGVLAVIIFGVGGARGRRPGVLHRGRRRRSWRGT